MLNWDEYNEEEVKVAPAIKNTIPEELKRSSACSAGRDNKS